MFILKFSGDYYHGDGLMARNGDTVKVSDKKAAQLLRDFPDQWEALRGHDAASCARKTRKAMQSPRDKNHKPGKNK